MVRFSQIALTLTAAILFITACGESPFAEKPNVVAKVGDKVLTLDKVTSLPVGGLTPEDSAKMAESYVTAWVKAQLKIQEAEKMLELNGTDIDSLVDAYRSSLLSNKLEQHYIAQKLDTVYTDEAIAAYYAEHKGDFTLDRAIVKGRIVRMPDTFRQKKKIKELVTGDGDKHLDLVSMVEKNRLELTEFDKWTDLSEFLTYTPATKRRTHEEILAKKDVQEMTDGTDTYYIYISESRKEGDTAPLERVGETIKRILYNQRRQEIIRHYEDSMYRAALNDKTVEIYSNK